MQQLFNFHCLHGEFTQIFLLDEDDCTDAPCANNGTCIDQVAGYICLCACGFTGSLCEEDINDCDPNPCLHGTCADGIASFTCDCIAGYGGHACGIGKFEPCQGHLPFFVFVLAFKNTSPGRSFFFQAFFFSIYCIVVNSVKMVSDILLKRNDCQIILH